MNLSIRMALLDYPERHHVKAAIGWAELGSFDEASAELSHLPDKYRENPEVLDVEWKIKAGLKQWSEALAIAERILSKLPEQVAGWIHRSYSLHELDRTDDAMECLLPAYHKFPEDFIVPYNLACYACRMGDLIGAKTWVERAIKRGDRNTVKKMALGDDDLAPLKAEIERL